MTPLALVTLTVVYLAGQDTSSADAKTIQEAAADLGSKNINTFLQASPRMERMVEDPAFKGVVCVPSDDALSRALAQDRARGIHIEPVLVGRTVNYHILPNATLSKLGVKPTALPGNNLTVLQGPQGTYVFFSRFTHAGSTRQPCSRYNDGRAQLCIVDTLMLPPTSGYNVYSYIANDTSLSILKALVDADSFLTDCFKDNDLVATIFAPTNEAFAAAFATFNVTAAQVAGSEFVRKLVCSHISSDLPFNSSSGPRSLASSIPGVTLDARPGIRVSIQGSGTVIQAVTLDGDAGKSIVHKIQGVLLANSSVLGLPMRSTALTPAPSLVPSSPVSDTIPGQTAAITPPSSTTSSESSKGVSIGIIVGCAVGGVLLLAILALAYFVARKSALFASSMKEIAALRQHKLPGSSGFKTDILPVYVIDSDRARTSDHVTTTDDYTKTAGGNTVSSHPSTVQRSEEPEDSTASFMSAGGYRVAPDGTRLPLKTHRVLATGLERGDPFLMGTAHQFSWTSYQPGPHTYNVEAGLTDVELDSYMVSRAAMLSPSSTSAGNGGGLASRLPSDAVTVCNSPDATGLSAHSKAASSWSNTTFGAIREMSCQEVQDEIEILDGAFIGRGATALVYKCRWPKRFGPDALLAIKVLKSYYEANAIERMSFTYEAQLLASVRHPNVVRMWGYCLESPTICIILELLPGALKDRLYSRAAQLPAPRPFTVLEVLQISAGVSAGLACLHAKAAPVVEYDDAESELTRLHSARTSQRIVHRDLKPGNILINSQGTAKISDFGLARLQDGSTLHTEHAAAGTTRYMAPELLVRRWMQTTEQPVAKPTNRVDIYSLAMVMYECLSHKKVWEQLSDAQVMTQVVAGQRPPLPGRADGAQDGFDVDPTILHVQAPVGLSAAQIDAATAPATFENMPEFVSIITKCWQQRVSRRPNASEVHQMISNLLAKHINGPGQC